MTVRTGEKGKAMAREEWTQAKVLRGNDQEQDITFQTKM